MKNYKNVIYILTNPLYAGYIKIGYASDLNQRLSSLNTGMLRNFEAYAVYETDVKNADKQFHALIDDLAPIVRARVINGQKVQDKEFFKLEPEQAYDLLHHIAVLTGTENRLHKGNDADSTGLPYTSPYIQHTESMVRSERPEYPKYYFVGSLQYVFWSWKDSLVQHCLVIIDGIGFDAFRDAVLDMKLSNKKSKRKIFAATEEEMRGFDFYKFAQGELYLLTNYSASCIQKINIRLNELFPEYVLRYE